MAGAKMAARTRGRVFVETLRDDDLPGEVQYCVGLDEAAWETLERIAASEGLDEADALAFVIRRGLRARQIESSGSHPPAST